MYTAVSINENEHGGGVTRLLQYQQAQTSTSQDHRYRKILLLFTIVEAYIPASINQRLISIKGNQNGREMDRNQVQCPNQSNKLTRLKMNMILTFPGIKSK